MGFFSSMAGNMANMTDAVEAMNREREVTEAQQRAIDLGIYEIVRNVALQVEQQQQQQQQQQHEVEWEGCRVIFKDETQQQQEQQQQQQQREKPFFEGTCVVHPNGTLLYQAFKQGKDVKTFRYGAWVERITAYSEQVTIEMQRKAESKVQKEREAKMKPFSGVDF